MIPSAYKQGMKDFPKKPHDIDSFNYMKEGQRAHHLRHRPALRGGEEAHRVRHRRRRLDGGVEPAEGDRDRSPAIGHERPT